MTGSHAITDFRRTYGMRRRKMLLGCYGGSPSSQVISTYKYPSLPSFHTHLKKKIKSSLKYSLVVPVLVE
uniref:Uncharacterized protein n=1 Tax=Oryza sativa subsp. japonica TaxID=39947 RepID=Q6YUL0_ORYSJ|nr:hypothetical protein [Oryza sativa Japonica Group]